MTAQASLLLSRFSVRSERTFCEKLGYNLLFRWFLDVVEPGFAPGVFSKNRQWRLAHAVGQALFDEVVGMAYQQDLLSDHHFAVDGTLIEAAAGFKPSASGTRTTIPATRTLFRHLLRLGAVLRQA